MVLLEPYGYRWFRIGGRNIGITLQQVDSCLAILEYLGIVAAVVLVVMMAAVYAYTPRERKTYALAVGRRIDPLLGCGLSAREQQVPTELRQRK